MNNILEYLEENMNTKNSDPSSTQLQVWNNAAFDGQDLTMKTSWSSSSHCTKENLSPTALNISSSSIKNSEFKNHQNIDDEIALIESEITRLTSRLESLRLEKAKRKIASEKRVSKRVVASKFMEPKRNAKVTEHTPIQNDAVVSNKVTEQTPKRNAVVFKDATPKPNAVVSKYETPKSNWRRGMSLGPVEIASRIPPPATTPATLNRRKSCFWKPQEINEQRRQTIFKANTVGANAATKRVKKKEEDLNQVQPRNLFAENEKSKKVLKQGRVVPSRYNSNSGSVDVRKRSFPENSSNSKVRVKKRWEIPVEHVGDVSDIVLLPKISIMKYDDNESPRDSGAAKRVSQLTGKKSYFCPDDHEEEGSASQVLSFAEDDGEQQG